MTDKELKKLSRLELLELLLTESRENERLREELTQAKQENTIEKSAQYLNEASKQLESALEKVNLMMGIEIDKPHNDTDAPYEDIAAADSSDSKEKKRTDLHKSEEKEPAESDDQYLDFNIYKRLIMFYIGNPDAVDALPDDIRKTVTNRINEIKGTLKPKADN